MGHVAKLLALLVDDVSHKCTGINEESCSRETSLVPDTNGVLA